jgi:hypothetical protein
LLVKELSENHPFSKTAIACLAAVIMAVSVGGIYLGYRSGATWPSSNSWATLLPPGNSSTSESSGIQSDGLDLALSLNVSTITAGQYVNISVWEVNSLGRNNGVTVPVNASSRLPAFSFPAPGMELAPCPDPMMQVIYRGYYTVSNISRASPLMLYFGLATAGCPETHYSASYTFAPDSSSIIWANLAPQTDINSIVVSGYYEGTTTCEANNDMQTTICPAFHQFSAGIYTIAAGDTWSALDLLYLTVA